MSIEFLETDFDRLKIKLDELKIIAEEQSAEVLINKMEEMVPTYQRSVLDMVAVDVEEKII